MKALLCPFLLCAGQAWAYSCNLSITSTGVTLDEPARLYDSGGRVTLNCTRNSQESPTLDYRIKADKGLNYGSGNRRVRHTEEAGPPRYVYKLRRAISPNAAASCGNDVNWAAQGDSGLYMTGKLEFGGSMNASANWNYCVRISLTPENFLYTYRGLYTDIVMVQAEYGPIFSSLTTPAPFTYSVGIKEHCVFNTFPESINFNYTSFSPRPEISRQSFFVRCNRKVPWSVAVFPPDGSALGLSYTLSTEPPASVSTVGTGEDQRITLTGTMPAGQSGDCNMATCSARRTHEIRISY
jgi:hypothetical protein